MQRTTAGKRSRAARKRLIDALMTAMLATPLALCASPASAAAAVDPREALRESGCQALTARVAAIPGDGPVMLASYEAAPGGQPLPGPLQQSAFVYDNALAGIALIACGQPAAARRIADGVVAGVGLCEATAEQAYLKECIIRQAADIFVLADSTKLGRARQQHWTPLERAWTLVTDAAATAIQLDPFHALKQVRVAVAG